ncbi:MAG TPA: hypothetical protein VKA23_05900 [Mariprofundaceae bacterium]|nr:hypothetical protein [Mariprofundaceae bacterium]
MTFFKLIPVLLALLISSPAMAEEPTQPDLGATADMADEQGGDSFITGYQKPEREGPATATDKIVDRFMELNTNPEESAGVDFEEYFTMVQQRATDRFALMDANKDDEVTADEYREFWKAQKAQYYRLKR